MKIVRGPTYTPRRRNLSAQHHSQWRWKINALLKSIESAKRLAQRRSAIFH